MTFNGKAATKPTCAVFSVDGKVGLPNAGRTRKRSHPWPHVRNQQCWLFYGDAFGCVASSSRSHSGGHLVPHARIFLFGITIVAGATACIVPRYRTATAAISAVISLIIGLLIVASMVYSA